MIKIKSKNLSFENEFFKEDKFKQSNSLIEKLQSLDFKGSEYLAFNDIALNFAVTGIDKIINFCNYLYDQKIEQLIILTTYEIRLSVEAALEFLYSKNDINKEHKIKLIFINEFESYESVNEKINHFFNNISKRKIRLLFIDNFNKNQKLRQISSFILNRLATIASDFLVKKYIYYIGKKRSYKIFENYNLPIQNVLIASEDTNNNYPLFSEVSLVLLATQGVNVAKLIQGYKNITDNLFKDQIYDKIAIDMSIYYSVITDLNSKSYCPDLNLFIGYDSNLTKSVKLAAHLFNKSTLSKNLYNDAVTLSEQLPILGQSIISGENNKSIIYFRFKEKKYNYQLSSIVNDFEFPIKYEKFTIEEINEQSFNVFNNYLTSFNDLVQTIELEIDINDEVNLGEFFGLLYWCKILYCIQQDIDPFK
ncbi:hypothetical protein [Mycoplasmopsis gallinacea]|uniref:Glucose-6-phosphate isomerase n=1 Tax=Mycoplasmopsis gallinacea TaxID=29556 RepID=A0A6H0V2P3_9BACT|nr:hypothetical protein [Mycoplasmopsis gallinacea]QIW62462.1 hypothetical protein GOQ20_03520 [Mycoplasmopsis gallinacea]